jgi:hypothetical protein
MMEMAVEDPHGFMRKGRAWLAFSKIAAWPLSSSLHAADETALKPTLTHSTK